MAQQQQPLTMSQLAFRLETELSKLETKLNVGEMLLHINNKHKNSILQHRAIQDTVVVNKEYLTRIESDIHLYQYRIVSLSKAFQKHNNPNDNDNINDVSQILKETSFQIKKISDMFGTLNTGFIKKITPNSQQLLDAYDARMNPKYNIQNKNTFDKQTQSKYGKVLKDGYLIKQGHVRKSWKKRLFILTSDGFLRYYDTKQRLLNEIDLSTAKFLSVETEHSHYNKPFVFTVKVPNREFIFAAANENVRRSWIASIQKAMLKISSRLNKNGNNKNGAQNSKQNNEILYTLTKLEWNQLQNTETFADLQESLEDIADLQLVVPNKLKIIATSDSWITRHTSGSNLQSLDIELDWDEMINKIKQFFEKAHGDIIMQGWLKKKMEFRNWKKRWVVLKSDYNIDYYLTTKTDKKRGTINLSNVIGVREIFIGQYDVMKNVPDFVFEIENADRKVRFAAINKNGLKLWLKNIQEHCKYLKRDKLNDDDDSDGDEPFFTDKRIRRDMIDPIII